MIDQASAAQDIQGTERIRLHAMTNITGIRHVCMTGWHYGFRVSSTALSALRRCSWEPQITDAAICVSCYKENARIGETVLRQMHPCPPNNERAK